MKGEEVRKIIGMLTAAVLAAGLVVLGAAAPASAALIRLESTPVAHGQ
jgi:hypothetical protein